VVDDGETATGDLDEFDLARCIEASKPATVPVLAGYQLDRLIGQGSFGQVWGGKQLSTGQSVAVKFLTRVSPVARDSIRREVVRLASMSAYPGVVAILDADLDHNPPFLVSPLMRESLGELMRKRIAADAVFAVELAVEHFASVLKVLGHIHAKGFFHCDIKPDNLLIDQAGHVAVADFGQAMSLEEEAVRLGTYYYMCPQQAQLSESGGHLHPPCAGWDLYSLGATVYFMLTGQQARWNESWRDRISQTVSTRAKLGLYCSFLESSPLAPVRTLNPDVDPALAHIVERCLELNPQARYREAEQVLQALAQRAAGRTPKTSKVPLLSVLLLLLLYSAAVMVFSKTKFEMPTFSPTSIRYLRTSSSGHHLSVIVGLALQTACIGGWVGAMVAYLRPTR
jgi:serine/threonine protein kinase